MNVIESLKPNKKQRVIDLVKQTGADVEGWSKTKGSPASNPAYCYEWAFIEREQFVILNVWHETLKEKDGEVWCELNLRVRSAEAKATALLKPSTRGSLSRRALKMDDAIAYASKEQLPVRVIVGIGNRRDLSDPKSKNPSRMKLRHLDSLPWAVKSYNYETGDCRLARGEAPRYVDQFSISDIGRVQFQELSGKVWKRDKKVREAVLLRAKGKCELCGEPGFEMTGGRVYLETHHVIQLSEDGVDHESNVVAICPNDHRRAHHGLDCEDIKKELLEKLAQAYDD